MCAGGWLWQAPPLRHRARSKPRIETMRRSITLGAVLLAALVSAGAVGGCSDEVEQPPPGDGGPNPNNFTPAPGGARRLTVTQYVNSIRLLFGEAAAAAATPPEDY